MRKTIRRGIFALGLFFVLALFSYSQPTQEKVDNGKIVGTWKVEIDAGGEYYYLTLEMRVTEGNLEGTVSESQGIFTNLPISEILFDGENLSFEFTSPTPPDGLQRLVKAEFKVGVDNLEGMMSVPDIEATVPATATREKK
jgi:hypothetical protein